METSTRPLGLEALDKAIASVGLTRLSEGLGVKYQLIQGWRAPHRRFATPAEWCPSIEKITERKVTCEELRPDVDWSYLRGTAEAVA